MFTFLWFFLGVAAGVLLALPVTVWWNRATEKRVRQLEQQARSNERLAEAGSLTSGLAHEIKNPLSTVGLNIQLIQEDLRDYGRELADQQDMAERFRRTSRRFDTVAREATRLREILEDFLRFAGRMEIDRKLVHVNAMIDELSDFFEPQATAEGVRLRCSINAERDGVLGDENLLKQAVLNLMINAVQAMAVARASQHPHGGADELLLRTLITRGPGQDKAARIEITIMDTGPGVDSQLASKIFQPYFSTKKTGTGLGLPTSRRIIEEHGGQLTVTGEPGRGSEFKISLPLAEPSVEETEHQT